jgi:S-DNA-T family DNA segregation ATPase FtsK/SpoIIIE
MSKAKQPAWPLAKSGTVDLFAPFPFATDKRGRWIDLTLFEANVLIGALPGAGKTALVRLLALAAGLDPLSEVWLFELYGKGDLSPTEKFAARYGAGMDDETIERALFALRDALDDIQRRAEVLKGLPRDLAPDGKTSRRAAENRKLGLHPLVIVLDECQNLFQHEDYGKEAGELAIKVIRMGRAVGVILILSTQRPDKDAIPTGVSALAAIRVCLRVMEQLSNDMILGTGMYKAGVKASMLRKSDRGVGWLVGVEDDPLIARSSYQDLKAADKIADRARALRVEAGTLSGHAAGETEPDRGPRATVLRDLLQVFMGRDRAHSDDLCERLSDVWPERYQGWGPRQLGAALTPFGVTPKQVWAKALDGEDRNRYGLELAQIAEAFNRFQAEHGGS